jgi:hypothetical protein
MFSGLVASIERNAVLVPFWALRSIRNMGLVAVGTLRWVVAWDGGFAVGALLAVFVVSGLQVFLTAAAASSWGLTCYLEMSELPASSALSQSWFVFPMFGSDGGTKHEGLSLE